MTEKPEKKVHLTVVSLSGNYSGEFNVHQKLQHVVDKAFHELHIIPSEGEVWLLTYQDRTLDLQQDIEAAGIPDQATLKLAPQEGGGGV